MFSLFFYADICHDAISSSCARAGFTWDGAVGACIPSDWQDDPSLERFSDRHVTCVNDISKPFKSQEDIDNLRFCDAVVGGVWIENWGDDMLDSIDTMPLAHLEEVYGKGLKVLELTSVHTHLSATLPVFSIFYSLPLF